MARDMRGETYTFFKLKNPNAWSLVTLVRTARPLIHLKILEFYFHYFVKVIKIFLNFLGVKFQ